MHDACENDLWRYNDEMLDDPVLPEVAGERVFQTQVLCEHVLRIASPVLV